MTRNPDEVKIGVPITNLRELRLLNERITLAQTAPDVREAVLNLRTAVEVLTDQLSPYGNCPVCGAPGQTRERRLGGNDTCADGHTYPSRAAQ